MDFEDFIRQGNSLVEYAHEIVEVLQTEMVEVELKSVLDAFSVVADKALKGKENLSKATNALTKREHELQGRIAAQKKEAIEKLRSRKGGFEVNGNEDDEEQRQERLLTEDEKQEKEREGEEEGDNSELKELLLKKLQSLRKEVSKKKKESERLRLEKRRVEYHKAVNKLQRTVFPVQFDVNSTDTKIRGCFRQPVTNTLQTFEFDLENQSKASVADYLWDKVDK